MILRDFLSRLLINRGYYFTIKRYPLQLMNPLFSSEGPKIMVFPQRRGPPGVPLQGQRRPGAHGWERRGVFVSMAVLALAGGAFCEAVFDVISLDGSAKVQRVQKKEWEKLVVGSQVNDNDIVETYFQAKIVLQFGRSNVAILGSNSKALVNIREQKADTGAAVCEVNLTLFSGGCFVKAVSHCHISVYTSNAVGETDNGSFSAVVESKSGETGFQTLGGNVKSRNIAQKEGIRLVSGQTTMILPGKEPTAPLYITTRHVSVLKHFFGDDYIDAELGSAGIKPTEESGTGTTSLSQAMLAEQYGKSVDQGMYKIPFSLNKVYGSILDDRDKNRMHFNAIRKPELFRESALEIQEDNSFALARGGAFPAFTVTPSYTTKILSAGLRLPFATNYTGQLSMYDFSSAQGFFDLFDHVTVGPFGDSMFVRLGALENYTVGDGLVVDGFNAHNPYSLFHPLSLSGQIQLYDFSARAFIADLSSFSIGGIHVLYEPSIYHFGAGYFYDASQYQKTTDPSGYRFADLPQADSNTIVLDSAMTAFIYQLDLGVDILNGYDLYVAINVEFAQKLAGLSTDGWVLRAPSMSFNWSSLFLKTGLVFEGGRLVEGEFNSIYMSNRARVLTSGGLHDTLISQNTMLSKHKSDGKAELAFGINPVRGISIEADCAPMLYNRSAIAGDPSAKIGGVDFGFSLSVNDSLFAPIKWGTVYVRQTGTDLYPPRSPFPSWGFQAGLELTTNPILFGIGFSAGFSMFFLDLVKYNDIVDPATDNVLEFSFGIRRGFL
jgi:hypothetical protein